MGFRFSKFKIMLRELKITGSVKLHSIRSREKFRKESEKGGQSFEGGRMGLLCHNSFADLLEMVILLIDAFCVFFCQILREKYVNKMLMN